MARLSAAYHATRSAFLHRTLSPLAIVLCTLVVGCSDCSDHSSGIGLDEDAGNPDAGRDAGPPGEVPGERPTLSEPGQIVPLLWGRVVELRDDEGGADVRFALDDPTQTLYQRFFGALDRACSTDFAATVTAPTGISTAPGCDGEGAYAARLHRCRAEVASALIAGDGKGLIGDSLNPRLNIPEHQNAGTPLWTSTSSDNTVRASLALLVVAELRETVARASFALDPQSCTELSDVNAVLLASELRTASQELPNRTQSASGLLRQSLTQIHKEAGDDDATRTRVTRALNHSLLEEQKLYAGIPYAAFSPLDPREDDTSDDRYPALLSAEGDAARAATLLDLSASRFVTEDGKVEAAEALGLHFVEAVRAHEPFLLGQLARNDVAGVLRRFDLSASDLEAGAAILNARLRVSGVPNALVASLDAPDGLQVRYADELAPNAYVHAITSARANRSDEALDSYARRGMHHALDAARLASERARTRADLPAQAVSELSALSASTTELLGTLQVCEDESALRLTVLPAESSDQFELWSGELGAACAREAECDDKPYRVVETNDGLSDFALSRAAVVTRYYLTARRAGSAKETRVVVASVSSQALDGVVRERCYFEPLSQVMHDKMRALHDRSPLPVVPRSATPLLAGSTLQSEPADPVSLTGERRLSGLDADSDAIQVELDQPFSTSRLLLEQGLNTLCGVVSTAAASATPRECGARGLASANALSCRASWALKAAQGSASLSVLKGISLQLASAADHLSLRLFSFQLAQRASLAAADVLDTARCAEIDAQTALAARSLLSRLAPEARTEHSGILAALELEASAARASEPDATFRRILRTRGLSASSLASARVLITAPRSAYEPPMDEAQPADPFDHAFDRFPVVTRAATLAEDTRAERLLRQSGLSPWLSDLTVFEGRFDPNALAANLSGTALASRLRTRLVALEPATYASLPVDSNSFLDALGISNRQLRDAAARISQTAEIRGLSMLPLAGTTPQQAIGTAALFPAPNGVMLAALSAGKLQAARDALPKHFALRGHYHTSMGVAEALRRAPLSAQGAGLDALRADLAADVQGRIVIEQLAPITESNAFAIERSIAANVSDAEAKAQTLLLFSDSGLACALTGQVAGQTCSLSDYLLDLTNVKLTTLEGASGSARRVRLEGYQLPTSNVWDWPHVRELSSGRIYALEQHDSAARALAGVTIAPAASLPVRHELPVSAALDLSLLELLAFRAPGEACAACRPRSVCETTRCDFDLCVREPSVDGKVCGVGMCEQGACSVAGCGDGARADGSDDVPYEACDDGNRTADDGCSASCLPELRNLQPTIAEGFPAGPATAIGTDGLGRQLLVYTADALEGENQLIRAAALDAFGVQSGSERTLDAQVPRVFISEPCVAGLRDGGFAVVYGSPDIASEGGIGVRIVSSAGTAGRLLRVDDGNATAGSARVASVEDGFVVVYSQRSGSALLSRVRARRFDAQGAAIGASFEVSRTDNLTDQVEPTVATSLGQILIVWSERDAERGGGLSIRARRFSPFGSPIDGDAFDVVRGNTGEPSVSVLGSDDYLIAWTSRDVDPSGDIARRKVQRFGLPLALGDAEPWITGPGASTRPVVASLAADAVLAYQAGSPLSITALAAFNLADTNATSSLAAALASAKERDVSAVSTPLGVWFVWSEREAQGRALFAYLLPARAAE